MADVRAKGGKKVMGRPIQRLDGKRFGRLVVLRIGNKCYSKTGKYCRYYFYLCRCDCGSEVNVSSNSLTKGTTRSCGCLRREHGVRRGTNSAIHGHSRVGAKSSTYKSWEDMKLRCQNSKTPYFKYYGAKGIKVCERWQRFENFLADMGEKPVDGWHIDRINPKGNYEPSNCRWLSPSENVRRQTEARRALSTDG